MRTVFVGAMGTDPVKVSERFERAARFARFCISHKVSPEWVALLCECGRRAFKAGERYANEGTDSARSAESRAGARFERVARDHGFAVSWPGLWPLLHKGGEDITLPSI